ncbi:hypothetical protein H6775_02240 [Candidatus Nomurabacteria bacterium]|nr:hypothetical protein [Candidatus Nomurabacteria bacterium]
MKHTIDTLRHGAKAPDGNLSELGQEQARNKGDEYFQRFVESPPGTLFFILPSNVSRAIDTGKGIEDRLRELIVDHSDMHVLSIQEDDWEQRVNELPEDKFIITDLHGTRQFGLGKDMQYVKPFQDYTRMLGGEELSAITTWVAWQDELEEWKAKAKEMYPEIDPDCLHPESFVQTPEEQAIKYIMSARRMAEIANKHFPDRPYIHVQAGHNTADLTALALSGQDISANNLQEFMGGKGRDFVESSSLEFNDEETTFKFRGKEYVMTETIDEVIERLRKASDRRKKEWKIDGSF